MSMVLWTVNAWMYIQFRGGLVILGIEKFCSTFGTQNTHIRWIKLHQLDNKRSTWLVRQRRHTIAMADSCNLDVCESRSK